MAFDFTELPGVGPSISENLVDAGYETLDDIVDEKATVLAEINGISGTGAERLQSRAREELERLKHETIGNQDSDDDTAVVKLSVDKTCTVRKRLARETAEEVMSLYRQFDEQRKQADEESPQRGLSITEIVDQFAIG